MEEVLNCFIPLGNYNAAEYASTLKEQGYINKIYFLSCDKSNIIDLPSYCQIIETDNIQSGDTLRKIAELSDTPYSLIQNSSDYIDYSYKAFKRMIAFIESENCGAVYSNYFEIIENKKMAHPLNDYNNGCVRDDFDFGSLMIYKSSAIKKAVSQMKSDYQYPFSALYFLRLNTSISFSITHVNEYLYTKKEHDTRKSGEKMFDYVNPRNREVQIDMENVFTDYLEKIDARIYNYDREIDLSNGEFAVEASVIIPVRDRVRTIGDAIESVLNQKTNFDYNIIIVDNHSTDGTTETIDKYCDNKILHIIPNRNDLGIGGCWDMAVNNDKCGRFAVQLDSDDIYSDENTLQKIVDAFYEQKCGMIVGSYRMTDFKLNTLPPGVIDHKEWTEKNGMNNALRINGLGAPRAFFTPLLREIGVPNVSYGEDYALGLTISREYRIGRIYDVLYLCRRWEGNSDSSLSIEKTNLNNKYKDSLRELEIEKRIELNKRKHDIRNEHVKSILDVEQFISKQLNSWDLAFKNHNNLKSLSEKSFDFGKYTFKAQFNAKRIVSSGAKLDKKTIEHRKCFLCEDNQSKEQMHYYAKGNKRYNICINPYPILEGHLTIPSKEHEPQQFGIIELEDMIDFAKVLPSYFIFYNGAGCGASAPDHFHFQAAKTEDFTFHSLFEDNDFLEKNAQKVSVSNSNNVTTSLYCLENYLCPVFILKGNNTEIICNLWKSLNESLLDSGLEDGMYNILTWIDKKGNTAILIIPRSKHRPECYFAEGKNNMMISPGALDMAGIIVMPREEDFEKVTDNNIKAIMQEVGISKELAQKACMKINRIKN